MNQNKKKTKRIVLIALLFIMVGTAFIISTTGAATTEFEPFTTKPSAQMALPSELVKAETDEKTMPTEAAPIESANEQPTENMSADTTPTTSVETQPKATESVVETSKPSVTEPAETVPSTTVEPAEETKTTPTDSPEEITSSTSTEIPKQNTPERVPQDKKDETIVAYLIRNTVLGLPTTEVQVQVEGETLTAFGFYYKNILVGHAVNGKITIPTIMLNDIKELTIKSATKTYQGSTGSLEIEASNA